MTNFVCEKDSIKNALDFVSKASSSKTGVFGLSLQGNALTIISSDGIMGTKCVIPVQKTGDDVNFSVSNRTFPEIIRKMEGEISLTYADNMLGIVSGNSKFKLITSDASSVMEVTPAQGTTVVIASDILKKAIKNTSFATSKDDSRPIFTGCLLDITPDSLIMVGTNTHRLAKSFTKGVFGGAVRAIIPSNALNILQGIAFGDIEIVSDGKKVSFGIGEKLLTCSLISGSFPDYTRVIPQFTNDSIKVSFNVQDMIDSLERVNIVASAEMYSVFSMQVAEKQVSLLAQSADLGTANETIPCVANKSIEIKFNTKYVLDGLKCMKEDASVDLILGTPLSPGVLMNEEFTYVISPTRQSA